MCRNIRGEFAAELDRSELASRIAEKSIELEKAMSQYDQTRLDTLLTLSKARDEQVNLRFAMEEAKLQWEGAAYEAPSVRRQAEISYDKSKRAYEQAVELHDAGGTTPRQDARGGSHAEQGPQKTSTT